MYFVICPLILLSVMKDDFGLFETKSSYNTILCSKPKKMKWKSIEIPRIHYSYILHLSPSISILKFVVLWDANDSIFWLIAVLQLDNQPLEKRMCTFDCTASTFGVRMVRVDYWSQRPLVGGGQWNNRKERTEQGKRHNVTWLKRQKERNSRNKIGTCLEVIARTLLLARELLVGGK